METEVIDRPALFHRQGDAGGVLEVGDDVEHFCPGIGLDGLLQPLDGDAVGLHRDPGQVGPADAEGIQGPDEGGILTKDGIPFVCKALGRQIDGLLGSGGDDDSVPGVGEPRLPAVGELLGRLPKLGIPFGDRILESRDGLVFKNDPGDVLQLLHRKGVRGRVAPGKGNNGGIRHVLKDLPDG